MKSKFIIKICIDIGMTILLLFIMSYMLVGEKAHELLGTAIFVLFILHHILNLKWWKSIIKGKYTTFRTVQTVNVILILCLMIGSAVSAIVLSRHIFTFLDIKSGSSWARVVHIICAYWGFVLMSVHLGFHWQMMTDMAKRKIKNTPTALLWILRSIGYAIAAYGLYAFFKRNFLQYMLLISQFVFFDFNEKLIFFILDYASIMGFFVFVGYYTSKILLRSGNKAVIW